ISNLLALFFYSLSSNGDNSRIGNREEMLKSKDLKGNALTERQLLILKMMAEGRTNLSISGVLGYSESTIRHETIKVYAKLGCTGRVEASTIYQEIYANGIQEPANPDLELQSA
ncbi:MAG: helix-turn-helix transcriptional regulator, partial [Candidatus Nanopelagicaceae bacterium]